MEYALGYSYGKNTFDLWVDLTKNGRLTAVWVFCYNILYMHHVQYGGATCRLLGDCWL